MLSIDLSSISYTFICPDCGCKFGKVEKLIFQGTHVLGDCLCECCENRYYHTLPIGHDKLFPISFSQKTTKTSYDEKLAAWLAVPLIRSVRENLSVEKAITKKIFKESKNVIVLNCLDSCYGHVFLKLLNAQKYIRQYPDKGLIVLVPTNFLWLMPEGVAEVWQVEIRLREIDLGIANLDAFIKEEFTRFDSVLLSEVPVHPDLSQFDMKDFLKTEKFDLDEFETQTPRITFILREERFWVNNKLDAFLLKLSVSRGWTKSWKPYFAWKQNRLIRKLVKEIQKRSSKEIQFFATGIGKTYNLIPEILDHRKITMDDKAEKEWCDLFASSHLVIGVHGSNMLIPTALAAGFIELLPRYKIYNYTEDIAMDHKGRYMQFLGRYLDEFSSRALIAQHAVSMLEWFPVVRKNMES
ncbi:MAG TPA: hypothetical protein VNB90_01680 [Cytophagaceae bacterium]|nr:hypothetical protein [Cytophagaceae bacterium]